MVTATISAVRMLNRNSPRITSTSNMPRNRVIALDGAGGLRDQVVTVA